MMDRAWNRAVSFESPVSTKARVAIRATRIETATREQNEECGHTGVGSVKLEATRGFGGLHMGSAAQAGVTVGGRMSGGAESIEGLPSD